MEKNSIQKHRPPTGGRKSTIPVHVKVMLKNIVDYLPDLMLGEIRDLLSDILHFDIKTVRISDQLKILGFT